MGGFLRSAYPLLLFVLMFVLSGCATSTPSLTTNQLQDMGEKYVAAGDTANALKFLTEAEKKKPDSAVIQYDLGLAYNKRGMQNEALAHLQKALKINPAYPEAWNAIGTVYAERGQIELAQEAFQKAVNDPFYQTPQLPAYNLGRLYEKKGDTERALMQYQDAVKFDPNYGLAWYRIGQIQETMRRGDEARHSYGKAVTASPDLAEAHLRYGVMSYLAGDMEAALFSLNRVTRLAPDTAMADEARKYLDKLRGVATISPTDIEVISNGEVKKQQIKSQLPPPQPDLQPPPIMEEQP